MSLINRVLRDLSGREQSPGDVMSGIELPPPMRSRRRAPWRRIATLILLVAAFTAVLWLALERVRRGPARDAVIQASAPRTPIERFKYDGTLDAARGPAEPSVSAAVRPERPRELRLEGSLTTPAVSRRATPRRADTAPPMVAPEDVPETVPAPAAETEVAAAPEPAAAAAARPRDSRASQARAVEASRALAAGEPAAAEQALREALELDPRNHAARESLVTLLVNQERYLEAQALLDEGLALEPNRLSYRRLAARIDLARGEPLAAMLRLERAPPTLAADPEYHGLLASAYQRVGRHDDASRVYQSLTRLQPTEAHWWAGYGLSRDALGDRGAALASYSQARQLGQLDPRVLEHINGRTAALQAN